MKVNIIIFSSKLWSTRIINIGLNKKFAVFRTLRNGFSEHIIPIIIGYFLNVCIHGMVKIFKICGHQMSNYWEIKKLQAFGF